MTKQLEVRPEPTSIRRNPAADAWRLPWKWAILPMLLPVSYGLWVLYHFVTQ